MTDRDEAFDRWAKAGRASIAKLEALIRDRPLSDERDRFEEWARQFRFDLRRCDPSYVNEPYANDFTDWCWLAWLAAIGRSPKC